MTSRELAIARSVIYASLFDYPLTLAQLHHTLIESDQTEQEILAVYDGSARLQGIRPPRAPAPARPPPRRLFLPGGARRPACRASPARGAEPPLPAPARRAAAPV